MLGPRLPRSGRRRTGAVALTAVAVLAVAAAASALALTRGPAPQTAADLATGRSAPATPARGTAAAPAKATRHDAASAHRAAHRAHRAAHPSRTHRHHAGASTAPASQGDPSGPASAPPAPSGPPSDAEVRRELARSMGLDPDAAPSTEKLLHQATLMPDGLVNPPAGAPPAVQAVIAGGNQVAHKPYVYGGGHGRWIDTAYDCSGSVSFALANAGLLDHQLDSTQLAHWGDPGPGKWITIYANAEHAWMVVAGVRFDTSGRTGVHGSRWQADTRSTAGFTVRHPPGL